MSSFGAFIRTRRLALAGQGKDHSLRSVARRLGIQPAYLSRLERGGTTALSEAHLDALAKILGLDADVLHLMAGKAPPRLRQAAQDDAEGLAAQLCAVGIPPPAASVFDEPMLSRFVMDRVPDMVFWVDEDGRYFYVNQTACTALGYTRQEFQDLTVFDVNTGLTPELWPEFFADLRRNGRVRDHARLRRKDGRMLDVEVSAFAVDHMGGTLGVGFARDITGRKALERTQRLTQATVDAVSDMIFWVAPNGRFVNANPAACLALGYNWEELMALSSWDVNTVRTRESWPRYWDHVRMVGTGTSETIFRRKDGSLFDMELVTTYLEHDGREMLISTGRDITRRKRTEQRLRLAQFTVDQAQEGIFWVAPDGRYALVNDAGLRLLGYTREECLRLFVYDVDVQRTPGNWPASWALLKRRQTLVVETQVRRKDGLLVPVEIGLAYFTFDGQEYSAAFVRDITERAAAQASLLAESAVNKAQAEIAEALIQPGASIRGLAGIVQRVARALTGSAYGYASTMDPETGENVVHTFSAMMEQGQCAVPDQGVRFGQRTDGRYPCLWGHCLNTREGFFTNDAPRHEAATGLPAGHVPLRRFLSTPAVHDGLLLGQIALANPERDYTQADLELVQTLANLYALGVHRIRAERQLAEARDLADAANRAKGEFLANMSHEIRTPLNGVLGMLQVLQTTALDREQQDCVETAMQSGRNLLSLINDILDFSRIEMGKVAIASEPFSPEEVARVAAGIFQQQALHKGLLLNAEVSAEVPALVLGDAGRLRQILFNLLGNALKFTAQGSITLRAGTQPLPEDAQRVRLVFCVEDTGIGIPQDRLESIFEAFVQVDGELARRYQGTGLGLAIVRRLVGLMGGSVRAESEVGKGTRVVFDILAQRAPGPAVMAGPARQARSLRVLVAEDTPANQKALMGMLGSLGHTARVVENGARALEALEQEAFDLVLMDMRMPGLGGLETARLIRGREGLDAKRRIPIVAMTAQALPGDLERFQAAGMNEHLSKPVRLAELAVVLERLG